MKSEIIEKQKYIRLYGDDSAIVFLGDDMKVFIPDKSLPITMPVLNVAVVSTLFADTNQDLWDELSRRFKERYDPCDTSPKPT